MAYGMPGEDEGLYCIDGCGFAISFGWVMVRIFVEELKLQLIGGSKLLIVLEVR